MSSFFGYSMGLSYKNIAKHGKIALLDHLNLNHEKGRHDLLKVSESVYVWVYV